MLVLIPNPHEPIILGRRRKERPIGTEGQVGGGVGRPGLPLARPLIGTLFGADFKGDSSLLFGGFFAVLPELEVFAGGEEAVALAVPGEGADQGLALEAARFDPPKVQALQEKNE